MSQKKESNENKPGVKIQDLTPSKDAKGGGRRTEAFGGGAAAAGGSAANRGRVVESGGTSAESNKGLD